MGLFRRAPKLPVDRRPKLDRDERVLAWAAVSGIDGVVVATNLGLWLPEEKSRLGWHQIHKAAWDGRELAVIPAEVVEERDGYRLVADQPVRTFPLTGPDELPHQVRTRVTRSVAYTTHYAGAGGGVRVAARRVPGVDGLSWTARFDAGMPPADEEIMAEVDRLVEEARNTLPAD